MKYRSENTQQKGEANVGTMEIQFQVTTKYNSLFCPWAVDVQTNHQSLLLSGASRDCVLGNVDGH